MEELAAAVSSQATAESGGIYAVEPVECSDEEGSFETLVVVELEVQGNLTTQECEQLEELFVFTYNDLAQHNCDHLFRFVANT